MTTAPRAQSQEPDPGTVITEFRRANAALQAARVELSARRDAALAREPVLAEM